ncbi:MAG TPA: DUF4382 domain-containing protein [Gemmatimonadota bacterium]|nr:DUF4382 domain-containing protein [Gemmatimonadota bacterium]
MLGAAALVACGSSLTDPAQDLGEGRGNLTVLLTDAPFPFELVSQANVSISRVDIVSANEGILTIAEGEQTFNLLDLQNGVTAVLAQANLSAGTYPQIRLIVSSASVVLNDGATFDLFVPSGAQTGIKVLLPDFSVDAGGNVTLTLDFDVSESFVVMGNPDTPAGIQGFIFKPVVRPLGLADDDPDDPEDEEDDDNG